MELEIGFCFKEHKKTLKYKDELVRSMDFLAEDPRTIFVGQSVAYSGNAIYNTLVNVPLGKKLETPVFEDVQMGLSIGLALEGYVPVTCYPRFDFVLLASNQLVNHLDKFGHMSKNKMLPKVIVRTSVGSKNPLDGGVQHTQDYTNEFRSMLKNVNVVFLEEPEEIYSTYKHALEREDGVSTLVVEKGDFYNEK